MKLIRTAHEHGTIIKCEEMPNYFGFETTVHNSTTTQVWFIEEEGIEKCTSISISKADWTTEGIEIIAPSFNGTATEMETRIEVLQFAMAIAKTYEQ